MLTFLTESAFLFSRLLAMLDYLMYCRTEVGILHLPFELGCRLPSNSQVCSRLFESTSDFWARKKRSSLEKELDLAVRAVETIFNYILTLKFTERRRYM